MARRRPPASTAAPAPRPLSPGRQLAFRLVTAIGLPLVVLGTVELGLRLGGYGDDPGFTRRCVVQGRASWCENPAFPLQFFPRTLARRPSPFVFPAEKAPRTVRVFVLGESAAQGDPEPTFGLPRFLQAMLELGVPGVRFEVVNAGVVAVNSHALLPIARDLARRDGDVVVVYAGNNEVVGPYGNGTVLTGRQPPLGLVRAAVGLRGTRLGQLLAAALLPAGEPPQEGWRGMEMFLGQQVRANDPSMAGVYAAFHANLRDLVQASQSGGARVVLSTMGTRLRGFAPFASLHRDGLTPEALAAWNAAFDRGKAAEAQGRPVDALVAYREAETIDGEHAELVYRMGRSALAAGDAAAGRALLVRARDLDTLRFRADDHLNDVIRAVAGDAGDGVALVDGAAALGAASPDGLPGPELFWEHAHLTPEGNHALARALLPAVLAALPVGLRPASPVEPAPFEACAARLAYTGFDQYRIARNVSGRLTRPPFTEQLDHAEQVASLLRVQQAGAAEPFSETEARYRAAVTAAPGDPWLWWNYAQLLDARDTYTIRHGGKDDGRAVEPLRRALALLPQAAELRQRLAEIHLRLGHLDEAVAECDTLLGYRPDHPGAFYTKGSALARKGSLAAARSALTNALALEPSHPGAHLELASVLGQLGDGQAAVDHLDAAARFRPSDPSYQAPVVRTLEKLGRRREAAERAREAARRLREAGLPAEADAMLEWANRLDGAPAPSPPPPGHP